MTSFVGLKVENNNKLKPSPCLLEKVKNYRGYKRPVELEKFKTNEEA